MKNREDEAVTFARLQSAHDDQLIDSNELSVLLRTTRGRIHQLRHGDPQKLPLPLQLFGRRLVWRLGSVREWIRSLPVAMPTDGNLIEKKDAVVHDAVSTGRRSGRPRKAVKGAFLSNTARDPAVQGPCTYDSVNQPAELS